MPGQPRITIPFTASHQDAPVAEQRRLWQGTRKMGGPGSHKWTQTPREVVDFTDEKLPDLRPCHRATPKFKRCLAFQLHVDGNMNNRE